MPSVTLEHDINVLAAEERRWIQSVIDRNSRVQQNEDCRRKRLKDKNYEWKAKRRGLFGCPKCYQSWRLFCQAGTQCTLCRISVCSQCLLSSNNGRCRFCRDCYEEILELGKSGDWFRFKLSHQQLINGPISQLERMVIEKTPSCETPVDEPTKSDEYQQALLIFTNELRCLSDVSESSFTGQGKDVPDTVREVNVQSSKIFEVTQTNQREFKVSTPAQPDYSSRSYWENVNMLAASLIRWSAALEAQLDESNDVVNFLANIVTVNFSWAAREDVQESTLDATLLKPVNVGRKRSAITSSRILEKTIDGSIDSSATQENEPNCNPMESW